MKHIIYRAKCDCGEHKYIAELDENNRITIPKMFCWTCKSECTCNIHDGDQEEAGAGK